MKKTTLAICVLLVIALLATARWGTNAVNAPQDDAMLTPDTSLAVALSLEEMVHQSDVIAIGNCVATRSVWVDRSLVTVANVAVSETLKGAGAESLTVVLPGGVDANRKIPIAMTYPGAPRLTPGEDVFLFLTADPELENGYVVTGFSQGKFSIITDEDGEQMVSRDLMKTMLQDKNGVRRGQSNVTPLSQMKAKVRGHLGQQ